MKRRVLSVVLSLALAMSMGLVGCGQGNKTNPEEKEPVKNATGNENLTAPGQMPIVKNKITLTAYAEIDATLDLSQNTALKQLEKETNIHLEVTERPSNNADVATQKNLLLASGSYPEVFITGDNASFNQMEMIKYGSKDKIFIPLNSYIDKYGYEIKKLFDLRPEYKKIMVAPDNNIYAISRFSESYHSTANPKLWINQEWMGKLGIKQPETIDDFYNMLKAFKERDPNGNGKQDEIPLTAFADEPVAGYIANSYVPYNKASSYCYLDEKGKIKFSADAPAFRESLKFTRKLYKEGLLDIAAYSQTKDQFTQTIRKEPYAVGGYMAAHIGMGIDNKNEKAMAAYTALLPVKGPEGIQYQSSDLFVNFNLNGYFTITDKCKNPEAAFRLADYFANEECSTYRNFGQEGADWKHPAAGTKNMAGGEYKVEVITSTDEAFTKALPNRKFNPGPGNRLKEVRDTWQKKVSGNDLNLAAFYESRLQVETDKLVKYLYPRALPGALFMSEAETEEFNELKTNITNHVLKTTAQFVVGDRDIDTQWDAYVKELKNYKLDRFLELYQKAYERFQSLK